MRNIIMIEWNETIYSCPQPTENQPLRIELAGITHPDKSYRIFRSESKDIYVLEYVISGRGHLIHGGQYYEVTAGDVYFLQPHITHNYYSDPADPWKKIWFNLQGPLIEALCNAYQLHGVVYYHDCPLQEEFFRSMEIIRNWNSNSLIEFSLQIHRIFERLHTWRIRHPEMDKSPEGIRLKEYLDQNWQQKISIASLARLIRKSPAQMMRIFRRDWGDSPYNYVQKQRDFFARQYLENTNCPVKELAMMMGFQDEFYFSNWFKLRNGLSPTLYRKQFR